MIIIWQKAKLKIMTSIRATSNIYRMYNINIYFNFVRYATTNYTQAFNWRLNAPRRLWYLEGSQITVSRDSLWSIESWIQIIGLCL